MVKHLDKLSANALLPIHDDTNLNPCSKMTLTMN